MQIASLSDPDTRAFFEAISQLLPGFAVREAQLSMIEAVTRTLRYARDGQDIPETDGSNILLVSAGTGCGKTFGYAPAAIVAAQASGKKLIISSSTVSLQQQLVETDLPLLRRASPRPFTFALAKGRSRYVCRAKLDRVTGQGVQADMLTEAGADRPGGSDLATLLQLARDLANGQWNGDRDALPDSIDARLWEKVTTDRNGCSSNRCPYFSECAFYLARQQVRSADVIVANHAIVCAGFAMPPGSVLPDPGQCLLVLDEAHALPERVLSQSACRHLIEGAGEWLAAAADCAGKAAIGLALDGALAASVRERVLETGLALGRVETVTGELSELGSRGIERFAHGVLPDGLRTAGETLRGQARSLLEGLHDLRSAALKDAADAPHLVQRIVADLGFYVGRVANLVDTWDLMLHDDGPGRAPPARWLERVGDDTAVCAAPITAGARLRRLLWNRASASVLCSATLTACGSFRSYLQEAGLDVYPAVSMMELASPFDYPSCATLEVPHMTSDPRNHVAHTAEIVERLPQLIRARGVLILFASRRQMSETEERLPCELREVILMQGRLSKSEILKRHREAIRAGRRSIILGLDSFREGIDLAGELCEQVIIARIGFQVPVDPIAEARAEWVERNGGCAFRDIVVPEAGVKLAQGVGRLIRTESDRGTVTVLDRRLATSEYGKRLLRGLPPFRLQIFGRPGNRETDC